MAFKTKVKEVNVLLDQLFVSTSTSATRLIENVNEKLPILLENVNANAGKLLEHGNKYAGRLIENAKNIKIKVPKIDGVPESAILAGGAIVAVSAISLAYQLSAKRERKMKQPAQKAAVAELSAEEEDEDEDEEKEEENKREVIVDSTDKNEEKKEEQACIHYICTECGQKKSADEKEKEKERLAEDLTSLATSKDFRAQPPRRGRARYLKPLNSSIASATSTSSPSMPPTHKSKHNNSFLGPPSPNNSVSQPTSPVLDFRRSRSNSPHLGYHSIRNSQNSTKKKNSGTNSNNTSTDSINSSTGDDSNINNTSTDNGSKLIRKPLTRRNIRLGLSVVMSHPFDSNKVLLSVNTAQKTPVLQVPSGFMKYGETMQYRAARELHQWTGISAEEKAFKLQTCINMIFPSGYHCMILVMHASLPPSKLRAIEKRRDERNVLLPLPAPVSAPAPSRTSTTASPNNAFITQQPSTTTTDVEINNNYVNEEKNSNANIDNDDDGDSAEVSPPQPGVWLKVPAKNIEYHWIDWDRIASIDIVKAPSLMQIVQSGWSPTL